MGTVIEEIREKMGRFPEACVQYDASSVTYFPDNTTGFVVRLVVLSTDPGHERFSVYYGSSHEEFEWREAAVMAFGFGLSTGCRLREFSRGGELYRWVVEVWNKARWQSDWEIFRPSTAFCQFWRRPVVRCLQNRLIDLSDGSDPDVMAGELVPVPPGGGLPSLSAEKAIPNEGRSADEWLGVYRPPPIAWWQR
jgi:hypothetical protein